MKTTKQNNKSDVNNPIGANGFAKFDVLGRSGLRNTAAHISQNAVLLLKV